MKFIVDCQWGPWDAWSDCFVNHHDEIPGNCGKGQRTSSRKIEQREQFGGEKCALAASQRYETCDRPCPGRYVCKKLSISCIVRLKFRIKII